MAGERFGAGHPSGLHPPTACTTSAVHPFVRPAVRKLNRPARCPARRECGALPVRARNLSQSVSHTAYQDERDVHPAAPLRI